MINEYFTKAKEFLYKTKILPLITKKDSLQSSLDEIVKRTKPVPYEQIPSKSLIEFAKTIHLILDRETNPKPLKIKILSTFHDRKRI